MPAAGDLLLAGGPGVGDQDGVDVVDLGEGGGLLADRYLP
jgi:hypothetical protein